MSNSTNRNSKSSTLGFLDIVRNYRDMPRQELIETVLEERRHIKLAENVSGLRMCVNAAIAAAALTLFFNGTEQNFFCALFSAMAATLTWMSFKNMLQLHQYDTHLQSDVELMLHGKDPELLPEMSRVIKERDEEEERHE